MRTQRYNAPSGKAGKIFVGILFVELDRVCARKWNAEKVIFFNPLSYNTHKALIIPYKLAITYFFDLIAGIVGCLTSS